MRHGQLRASGGIARDRQQHGAAQLSQVRRRPPGRKRTKCAQTLTARTPWYGEGNSKPAQHTTTASWQAQRAGPKGRRRQGSKPHGSDSARGAGQRSRARRRYAGTPDFTHQSDNQWASKVFPTYTQKPCFCRILHMIWGWHLSNSSLTIGSSMVAPTSLVKRCCPRLT